MPADNFSSVPHDNSANRRKVEAIRNLTQNSKEYTMSASIKEEFTVSAVEASSRNMSESRSFSQSDSSVNPKSFEPAIPGTRNLNLGRVKTDNAYQEVFIDETVVQPEEEKKSLATNNSFLIAQNQMDTDY